MWLESEAALIVRMATFKEEEETGTLLYYASKGNVPILKHMLDNGTSVDVADYDGRTALHLAASEGHTAAVELLLEYGPCVNPCDRFNETVSRHFKWCLSPRWRFLWKKGISAGLIRSKYFKPLKSHAPAYYEPNFVALCCDNSVQPLANARRYGHKDICALLEAKGGFVKVHNHLTVCFLMAWLLLLQSFVCLHYCLRMVRVYLVRD